MSPCYPARWEDLLVAR
ncbi:hypothetical protein ACLHZW_04265 [Aeromonas media]